MRKTATFVADYSHLSPSNNKKLDDPFFTRGADEPPRRGTAAPQSATGAGSHDTLAPAEKAASLKVKNKSEPQTPAPKAPLARRARRAIFGCVVS